MKLRSTVFFVLLITVVLCANGHFITCGEAYANEEGNQESVPKLQEGKSTKLENQKAYNVCKDKCDAKFDWCIRTNVSTDKFDLCEDALEKCLQGCGSYKKIK